MRGWAIVIVLGAILTAACFVTYSTTQYTCLECRALRTTRGLNHLSFSSFSLSDYSQAYLASHPTHLHHWCWCGSTQTYSLTSTTWACGKQHPIWSLPVDVQARFATMVSPEEFQRQLNAIDSADRNVGSAAAEKIFTQVLDAPPLQEASRAK